MFWTTQPDACKPDCDENCGSSLATCGSQEVCGVNCGVPGLALIDDYESDREGAKRFVDTEWLRGLMINMLMTDGRKADTACGFRPGSQGGHWSESYMGGDQTVGTLLRDVPSTVRAAEAVALVRAYAQATMDRLVQRGLATKVEVFAEYIGLGRVQLDIIAYGTRGGNARVGFAGERIEHGWTWE